MYYEIESEFQIAAQNRAASEGIPAEGNPGGRRDLRFRPPDTHHSPLFTAALSKPSGISCLTTHKPRVTSHRPLIETPRLEFPANLAKQRLRLDSNRDRIALFSQGAAAPARKHRQHSPLRFLIANLELELVLNIAESIKYKFLIANKTRLLCPPQRIASYPPESLPTCLNLRSENSAILASRAETGGMATFE